MALSITFRALIFLSMVISSLGLSLSVSMNCFRCRYMTCIISGVSIGNNSRSGGCFFIGILVLLVLVFGLVVGLSIRFL